MTTTTPAAGVDVRQDLPDVRQDLPDGLRPLTAMHDAMRRDLARLERALRSAPDPATARSLARWFSRVTSTIVHHHVVEDDIVWPAIERWVPGFAPAAEGLTGDHRRLDAALERVADALADLAAPTFAGDAPAAARGAAHGLAVLLDEHLRAEERVVIPAVRDVVPPAEWQATETKVNRTGTFSLAAFALPWVLDDADPVSAAVIEAGLPAPFRLLHRSVWAPRYRRLVRAAFGPDV